MGGTPTLDRALNAALSTDADPVDAGRGAVAELEERWFRTGDRRTLRELRQTEQALGMR